MLPVLTHHIRYHKCLMHLDKLTGYIFKDRCLLQVSKYSISVMYLNIGTWNHFCFLKENGLFLLRWFKGKCSPQARVLGVILDFYCPFQSHMHSLSKSYLFHHLNISRILLFLPTDNTKYFNSLRCYHLNNWFSFPCQTYPPIQPLSVLLSLPPLFLLCLYLHWRLLAHCIKMKIQNTPYKVIHNCAPIYNNI